MSATLTVTKLEICLKGIRPVMFDRYPGNNKDQLAPLDKLTYDKAGSIVLPALNLSSFLSAQNTESATKRIMGKTWRTTAKAALSFVNFDPPLIPFKGEGGNPILRNSKQIEVQYHVARLDKGVPNPKERPVINLPWSLEFRMDLWKNNDLTETTLRRIFEEGGLCVGIGTYRGVFGKFIVETWKEI